MVQGASSAASVRAAPDGTIKASTAPTAATVDWEVTHLNAGSAALSMLAIDNGRWIYAADSKAYTVSIFNGTNDHPSGTYKVDYEPTGLAFDSADSILFVTNQGTATATLINVTTGLSRESASYVAPPVGIAYDPSVHSAFVATNTPAGILAINVSTTGLRGLSQFNHSIGSSPAAIVYDPATGSLLVDFSDTGDIAVVDPATLNVTRVLTGLEDPGLMLYDPDNNVVYIEQPAGANLTAWNASTLTELAPIEVGTGIGGLALDPAQHRLFLTCDGNASLEILDDKTGEVEEWGVTRLGAISGSIAFDGMAGTVDFGYGGSQIAVAAPPLTVNGSIAPIAVDVGIPVGFSAQWTGGLPPIPAVTWTFGDGDYANTTAGQATHVYSSAGTFYAFAETSDAGGTYASWGHDLAVGGVPYSLTPQASIARDSVDVGQPVNFTLPTYGGTAPFTYNWTGLPLGCTRDTNPAVCNGARPVGPYSISASAVDAFGFTARASNSLVFEVYPLPNVSTPSANRSSLDVGQNISFRSAVTTEGSGNLQYYWSSSSGVGVCRPSVADTLTCEGTRPGSFTVTLNATDADGGSAVVHSAAVEVYEDPVIETPTLSPGEVDAFTPVEIAVGYLGGYGTPSASWQGLPSGCVSYALNFTCVPTEPGYYSVRAELVDANGGAARSPAVVFIVHPGLSGSISGPRGSVSAGSATDFTATPTGGVPPYEFVWQFGDGHTGAGEAVSHAYASPGTYLVSETTTDGGNGSTSRTVVVTVTPAPAASVSLLALWAGLFATMAVIGGAVILVRRRGRPRSARPATRRSAKPSRRRGPARTVRYTLPFLEDDSWDPPASGTGNQPKPSRPTTRPGDPRRPR